LNGVQTIIKRELDEFGETVSIVSDNFELLVDKLRRVIFLKWLIYRPGEKPGEKIREVADQYGFPVIYPKTLKFPRGGDLLSEIHFETDGNYYVIDTEKGRYILKGVITEVEFVENREKNRIRRIIKLFWSS